MNENLKETIEKQEEMIAELQYYRENDKMNLANLEQLVKEYKRSEANLKE